MVMLSVELQENCLFNFLIDKTSFRHIFKRFPIFFPPIFQSQKICKIPTDIIFRFTSNKISEKKFLIQSVIIK